ncbi:hypothetical protein I4U23_029738 [Adineta vaga]|nr:hypothetical protein I4U23_029738 [Adineta vaga]
MSSLRNRSRLSSQTSITTNSNSHTLTNELYERKTKALEGGLKKLKVTTHREPTKSFSEANRTDSNRGPSQYTTDVLHDKPSGRTVATKAFTIQTSSACGQCEREKAAMKCLECGENYCTHCFDQFHVRGALQRHHYILLTDESVSPKKSQSHRTDVSPPLSSHRQDINDAERRYVITVNKNKTNESNNEKTNLSSSRQAFIHNDNNKPRRISSKAEVITSIHDPTVDQFESSEKLPNIEFNTMKKTSNEQSFTRTFRLVDKNSQAVYVHRPKRASLIQQQQQQQQPKVNIKTQARHSVSDRTNPSPSRTNSERLNNDASKVQRAKSERETIVQENRNNRDKNKLKKTGEQRQQANHLSKKSRSRSPSSLIKQSNSKIHPPQLSHSIEQESPVSSPTLLTHPFSSYPDRMHQLSTLSNPTSISERESDTQSNVVDEYSIARFNLVLDDIVDRTKLELANQMNRLSETVLSIKSDKEHSFTRLVPIESIATTMKRDSPFSFSHSLNKNNRIHSASSRNAADDAFFTDVLLQQVIPSPISPPLILECSSSKKWQHDGENHAIEQREQERRVVSRQSSIHTLSLTDSSHSIILDETPQHTVSQMNNRSQQDSSLLSSSLHIDLTSSDADLLNPNMEPLATSSRKNSAVLHKSLAPIPTRKSSTSTVKVSSPIPIARNSSSSNLTSKASSPVPATPKSNRSLSSKSLSSPEPIVNTSSSTTTISANDENVISPDNHHLSINPSNVHISSTIDHVSKPISKPSIVQSETVVVNKLLPKKSVPRLRQPTPSDDLSKFRKLEFSLHKGLKWEEASAESISSARTISSYQSSHIPLPHTQFAEDTSISDNEEYFNPHDLQLNKKNSNPNVVLNEPSLNICQDAHLPSNKNDAFIFQTQLPDGENIDPVTMNH